MPPVYDPVRTQLVPASEYGRLTLDSPRVLEAGSFATVRLVIETGSRGIATGGHITLFTECDSDWEMLQTTDPTGDSYLTVGLPGGVVVGTRIPDHKTVIFTVLAGTLSPGDRITVTMGDTSGGGRGTRVQTFFEELRYFILAVDAEGAGEEHVVDGHEHVEISGGDAVTLVVIAPSDVDTENPFAVSIKAEDRWGNPAHAYRGTVTLTAAGIVLPVERVEFGESDRGMKVIEGCRVSEPGLLRITAADPEKDIEASSNPITAGESLPGLRLFWGDPHSGQIADARKIGDYFRYARDISRIHFASYQRNDAIHSTVAYRIQQEQEEAFHEPGVFVPVPGFEWSGNLEAGGHHNVYFRRFGQEMKRWTGAAQHGEPGETDLPHVRELHRHYRYTDTVITPHVGGQHANLLWHDPDLEPALEVVSTHGTFEWFLRESIERGYKMGFVGGNDCHTGRPGDDRPGYQERRYAKGGLTGVYSERLDLASVLDAIKKRRCYATTGARIRASHTVSGHFMGEEFSATDSPEITVKAAGTGPLERVDIYKGLDIIHSEDMFAGRSTNRIRITWKGASRMSSYSGVVWDGRLEVSGSRIGHVETMRFDSPRSHFERSGDGGLVWQSWACGYTSGLIVELDSPDDAELVVSLGSKLIIGESFGLHGEAPPRIMAMAPGDSVAIPVRVADLRAGPVTLDIGHSDRSVTVEMAPMPGAWEAEVSVMDESPRPGINPYWARVTQLDQEVAWLSPVFVDFVGE